MPSKFNSTGRRPGKAVKKPYRQGGVARYQVGGGIADPRLEPRIDPRIAPRMDPRLMQQQVARAPTVTARQNRLGSNSAFAGRQGQQLMPGPGAMDARQTTLSPLLQQQLQQRLAAQQATGPTGPTVAMPRPGEAPRTLQPLPDSIRYGGSRQLGLPDPPPTDPQFLARQRSAQQDPAMTPFLFAQQEQRLGNPNYDVTGRINPATGQIARPRADGNTGWGAAPSQMPSQQMPQQQMNSPQALTGMLTPSQIPARQRGFSPFQFPHQQAPVSPQQMPQPPAFGGAAPQRQSAPNPWFPSTQRPGFLEAPLVPFRRGGYVNLKTGGRVPRKKGVKLI